MRCHAQRVRGCGAGVVIRAIAGASAGAAALAGVGLLAASAHAQAPALYGIDRREVTFSISYNQTVNGQSVFVVGDLAELGGGDVRKAVRLEPSTWPTWKLTMALPAGTTYTYRFIRRDDAPGRLPDSTNVTEIAGGGPFTATTPAGPSSGAGASGPSGARRAIVYHSGFNPPVLYWRVNRGSTRDVTTPFTRVEMTAIGPGRGSGEQRWAALNVGDGASRLPVEFYFTNSDRTQRDPAGILSTATYATALDGAMVQDGNVFSYVPAPSVSGWSKPAGRPYPESIASTNLNETRAFRVILPRGYVEHTSRRYPVVYFHDGQNMFEFVQGTFGTWNAHTTAADLTRLAQMREVIMVGVDNGPNRLSDYAAPQSGGIADRYGAFLVNELKPVIDANFRTLPGADTTITAGSSMGGQVSMYLGTQFPQVFTRIGAFSGAWNVYTQGYYNAVMAMSTRVVPKVYLDSGTQTANAVLAADNYWLTANLRDDMLTSFGVQKYVLGRDVQHAIGLGQDHNEAAWASRLPDALRYLVPATEEQAGSGPVSLQGLASGAIFDVNGDGALSVEGLYAQLGTGVGGATPRDVNLDGQVTLADAGMLAWALRTRSAGGAARGGE